ncbi:MAG: hypothetical protein AAF333_18860 [Planctomycetota bacterium]
MDIQDTPDPKPLITRRAKILAVAVLLLAAGYVAALALGDRGKPLELYAQTRTSLNTPTGGFALVEFALNQECSLKSIKVSEVDSAGEPGEPIWYVVGTPSSSPLTNVTYGTLIPNMIPHASYADAPRVRLRPDQTYAVEIEVAGRGTVDTVFTTDPPSN